MFINRRILAYATSYNIMEYYPAIQMIDYQWNYRNNIYVIFLGRKLCKDMSNCVVLVPVKEMDTLQT